jgi:hypothetical protein
MNIMVSNKKVKKTSNQKKSQSFGADFFETKTNFIATEILKNDDILRKS